MTRIKNCGLKSPDDVTQALDTGAAYAGFVHYEPSPRHITLAEMSVLVDHAKRKLKTVAVFVDPSDTLLTDVMVNVAPDYIQLHYVSDPSRIRMLSERHKVPIITALSVQSRADLKDMSALEAVSAHLLFDAKLPGSGTPFDWTLLVELALTKPWFLAGGLNADNVA